VASVAFSPDGIRVLTGSEDSTARVWNADGGGQPVEFKGHSGSIVSVAFSPDGRKVLTGSEDSTTRVWNADGSGQPVELKGHMGGAVRSVAFSPDGKRVLTGSGHVARVWILDARTILWRQSTYCLPAARRESLLDETPDHASEGYRRCLVLVERCKGGFEACQEVVSQTFGTARF
jgi:WD40 repeat protein